MPDLNPILKTDSYFFPHDYDARDDEKIRPLLRSRGWEGYGLFWALNEKLHQADGELDLDYDGLAYDLRTAPEVIKSIINDFKLYKIIKKGQKFTSERIKKNIAERIEKSEKARLSAGKRWGSKKSNVDANALPAHSKCNAINKERNKERNKENTPPEKPPISSEEIQNLRDLQWNDQKIKDHLITRDYTEAEIDSAMGKKF